MFNSISKQKAGGVIMMKLLCRIACVVAMTLPADALAENTEADPSFYTYHPMSVMSLGLGFNPSDVSRTKIRCIDATLSPLELGALSTQFSSTLVTNSDQLLSTLGLDAKVDASYLVFKGGATFNFKNELNASGDDITVVISARTEYGRRSLLQPKLTPEAQLILADADRFVRTCGSRFVNVERRGASVSGIITLHNVSREEKTAISTGVSGGGGWGSLSASGEAHVQSELSKAIKSGRADIQVVATGGNGFGGLAETVKALSSHPESIAAIEAAFGIYTAQFTAENSAPIGFHVESMEAFGWDPSKIDIWTVVNERRLRAMVHVYRQVSNALDAADGIQAGTDIRSSLVSPAVLQDIVDAKHGWESYLDKLAAKYNLCKANAGSLDSGCDDVSQPANLSIVPEIPAAPNASFRVWVDGDALSEVESRSIFYDSSVPLLDRVRSSHPNVKSAKAAFVVTGSYLVSSSLMFKGEPFNRTVIGLKMADIGATYDVASDVGLAGVMESIFKFTTVTVPAGNGTFYIEMRDSLGRVFDLDLYTAIWNSNPPYSNMTGSYTRY